MLHRYSRSFLQLRFTAPTIQIVDGTLFAASTSAVCEPRGTAIPSPPPVQAVVATAWLRRLVHSHLKTIFRKIHLANSCSEPSEQRRLVKQRPKLGWWFIGSLLLVAISLIGFGYIIWTPYKFGR